MLSWLSCLLKQQRAHGQIMEVVPAKHTEDLYMLMQASLAEASVSGVLSPTPTMSRSGPPSPSPAKLQAVTKEPPPAKEPSPPRTDRYT